MGLDGEHRRLVAVAGIALPYEVARIDADQPWRWLAAGWADLWQRPLLSLGYGLFVALAGVLIAFMPLAQGRLR